MLERIFFCVYRVGHTLVSISIYKTLRKSILGIAENAEIMCSVKCSTQSIFQRTTPERRFFACSSERRHWPNGLYNVLAVENTKRHKAFAAILWASLPAMLRQNSSSHLACGTISVHLHICTFAQKNVFQTCFKRALYAPAASHPTTYLADRIQKN